MLFWRKNGASNSGEITFSLKTSKWADLILNIIGLILNLKFILTSFNFQQYTNQSFTTPTWWTAYGTVLCQAGPPQDVCWTPAARELVHPQPASPGSSSPQGRDQLFGDTWQSPQRQRSDSNSSQTSTNLFWSELQLPQVSRHADPLDSSIHLHQVSLPKLHYGMVSSGASQESKLMPANTLQPSSGTCFLQRRSNHIFSMGAILLLVLLAAASGQPVIEGVHPRSTGAPLIPKTASFSWPSFHWKLMWIKQIYISTTTTMLTTSPCCIRKDLSTLFWIPLSIVLASSMESLESLLPRTELLLVDIRSTKWRVDRKKNDDWPKKFLIKFLYVL